MRKAKDMNEFWEIENTFRGVPNAFIQWKGTDVCMDAYCDCGCHFHIDDCFAYKIKCPSCKTVYACSSHIELIKLEGDHEGALTTDVYND